MAAVASTWRSHLKHVEPALRNNSPREKSASLESSRNVLLKTWPKKNGETSTAREIEKKIGNNSPSTRRKNGSVSLESTWPKKNNQTGAIQRETDKKSPTSRWSHLSATTSFARSKSPRKETPQIKKTKGDRITADELLAREFSMDKVDTPRQRSSVFLRTVELFEGEVPGKLQNSKPEDTELKIANAKLDFCSNEMIDMRKFIGQIEDDFLLIRNSIEKARDTMKDLKSE